MICEDPNPCSDLWKWCVKWKCFLMVIHNDSHVVFPPFRSLTPWLADCWLVNWLDDCVSGCQLYWQYTTSWASFSEEFPLSLSGFSFLPLNPVSLLSYPPVSFSLPPSSFTAQPPLFFPSLLSPPLLLHPWSPFSPPTTHTLIQPPTLLPPPCSPPHHPPRHSHSLPVGRASNHVGGMSGLAWHTVCLRTTLRGHADSTQTDQNVEIAVMW